MAREDMRLVEVMAMSEESLTRTTRFLDEEGLDYVVADHTHDPNTAARVSFPIPAHLVESVQTGLTEREVNDDIYTVVTKPETVVSDRLDHDADEYEEVGQRGQQRVARDELHSKAADLIPDETIFTILTAISAVVATAGVLLNSRSVMVGAMVIAPLLGPSMATSVSTVLNDEELFFMSARFQAVGGSVALVSAVTFALFVKYTQVGSGIDLTTSLQISSHTAPTTLLVVVALCAGVAGAVSLSTSGLSSLVGVMIAAAVMPPIGVVGVGIAWLRPAVVVGSTAVVLVNVLAINLGATVTLWYFGYHPREWSELRQTRSVMLRRILAVISLIGVLVLLLAHLPAQL